MPLRDLIQKSITEYPYEGTDVDIEGIESTIENLLKGMVTYSHKFTKTNNGYMLGKVYHSKDDIVRMFINQIK